MQDYSATITLQTPLTEDQTADLAAELSQYGATVLVRDVETPPTTSVQITVQAESLAHCAARAAALVEQAAPTNVEPVSLEVLTTRELERRLAHPQTVRMVGAEQVGEMLGVSRQRASKLADTDPAFPPPATTLPGGRRLWTETAALTYVTRRLAEAPGSGPRPRSVQQ